MRRLIDELADVADPRSPLGLRYALPSLPALAVWAMTPALNDSLTAAAEWCQRAAPEELAAFALPCDMLRGRFRVPSEKTLRRVLGLLDPAEVAATGFAYLKPVLDQAASVPTARTPEGLIEREQRRAHRQAVQYDRPAPKRCAYAVDGKCLRGARRPDGSRVFVLSAVRHGDGITLASREIGAKTNEIPGFAPLLDQIDDADLTGAVITVGALHPQRAHARCLVEQRGAHYLFTIKSNQRKLAAQLAGLPWQDVAVPIFDHLGETGYEEAGSIYREPDFAHAFFGNNVLLGEAPPAVLDAVRELAGKTAPVGCIVNLRHLGGVMSRPPQTPHAVPFREAHGRRARRAGL